MAVSITFTSTGGITGASTGTISGFGSVYNAVWNDLADCITVPEDTLLEPGYCYCFDGEKYYKSEKYLADGIIGIHSDTYGFAMGEDPNIPETKLRVAVAGFVLAYVDQEYPAGTPLTCTHDGVLTAILQEDKAENFDKIIATYWKTEDREEFGIANHRMVKTNGRKWVKVK